ncbi:MAG: 30S ribosomal protein S1 [Actinobacteria bacterium]|nr:30S ribosomal protein S1 [Actinomycetota bacterium]
MSEKEPVDNPESYMIMGEDGVLVPDYDQTIKVFDDGDIVVGEVVKVDRDEVLVDIGYKSEGAIPARELSIKPDADPFEIVKVGDRIEALVLQKEDKEGRLILSKKRAEYEQAWIRIQALANTSETIEGSVIEVVKGGLIVNIGLRGFLPASLVDLRRTKDLHQFIGQTMECRIIEMDRNRNNVVLSRRAVLEEEKKHEKGKLLEKIVKGAVLEGKISSIVDFGAFVDLGGIDGLIHISELCWNHIDHPSEVVAVGDDVKVQVLDVDFDRERISLGLRQTQEDPWRQKVSGYKVDQLITGKVTKLVPFGAFVEVEEGLEGLIHISELAHKHVEMPEEIVKVGENVDVKIVGIDVDKRRVSLSVKQTLPAPDETKVEAAAETEDVQAAADAVVVEEVKIPVIETAEEEAVVVEVVAEEVIVGEAVAEEVIAGAAPEEAAAPAEAEETADETAEETVEETVVEEVAVEEGATEAVEEVIEAAAEEEATVPVTPGSLEDVLSQMKKEHPKKGSGA